MKNNIETLRKRIEGDGLNNALYGIIDDKQKFKWDAEIKEYTEILPEYDRIYKSVIDLYDKGEITTLLDMLGIEKMPNPIFTAHYDNDTEMNILKNVFGKESIDSSGGDMNVLLARLSIEKNY